MTIIKILLFICSREMDSTTEGPGNTTDVNIVIKSWKDLYLVVLYYVPVAIAIDRFATPVWCAIGLLGNLISVRIWVLRRMRKCNRYVLLISSTFKKNWGLLWWRTGMFVRLFVCFCRFRLYFNTERAFKQYSYCTPTLQNQSYSKL